MAVPRSRAGVDRALAALNEQRHRLAGALVAMDTGQGGLAHLRAPGLRGATRRLADRLQPRIDALWAGFAALGTVLDTAERLRTSTRWPSRAQLAEIALLLERPIGALSQQPIAAVLEQPIAAVLEQPIADDTLPEAYRTVPVPELCRRLDHDHRQVRAALDHLDARVAAVIALLGDLECRLAAAGPGSPELDAHAATVRDLRNHATADPLGTDLDGPAVRALVTAVETTAARLAQQAAERARYPARRAALRETLDRLADAESRARDAYALATEKIHDPRLPPATDSEPALRRRLGTLDRLDVVAQDQALPALERAVTEALDHATARHEFADGLLARREELRGRLEAYRMKALRLGLIERADVHAGYTAARTLLWTAPCDLPAATRAVVAYQRSLLTTPGGTA
ncbi:hypothetical protein [Cryptosporangium minutisporangium]|uniref:CHAD domain-containing protein n=1 Tax=Cryptosporangium minutisporangium TaxID=113569 RepID=A0ABP6T0H5_9ACTN